MTTLVVFAGESEGGKAVERARDETVTRPDDSAARTQPTQGHSVGRVSRGVSVTLHHTLTPHAKVLDVSPEASV